MSDVFVILWKCEDQFNNKIFVFAVVYLYLHRAFCILVGAGDPYTIGRDSGRVQAMIQEHSGQQHPFFLQMLQFSKLFVLRKTFFYDITTKWDSLAIVALCLWCGITKTNISIIKFDRYGQNKSFMLVLRTKLYKTILQIMVILHLHNKKIYLYNKY